MIFEIILSIVWLVFLVFSWSVTTKAEKKIHDFEEEFWKKYDSGKKTDQDFVREVSEKAERLQSDFLKFIEETLQKKYSEKYAQLVFDLSELMNDVEEYNSHISEISNLDKYQDQEIKDILEHSKYVLGLLQNFKKDLDNAKIIS